MATSFIHILQMPIAWHLVVLYGRCRIVLVVVARWKTYVTDVNDDDLAL
jgi:hypothetical protein